LGLSRSWWLFQKRWFFILKPIPKSKLIHNIEVVKIDDEVITSTTLVEKVRCNIKKIRFNNNGSWLTKNELIVFVDKVNSTNYDFRVNDEIIFKGKNYTITDVKELYQDDIDAIHHWEVTC